MRHHLALVVGAFVIGLTPSVLADEPAQNTDRVAAAAPTTDTQNWTASAGAILNTGNTRAYAISGGTSFSITRGRHGFAFESTGNFGKADPVEPEGVMPSRRFLLNAKNLLSRARYDIFFAENHAGFASMVHRVDPLSGLDTRIQAQVGYQYNFIREEKHRLWSEVGYDFTFDNIHGANDANITYHSVRLFAGWDIHTSDYVAFKTGLEALFNVEDGEDVRLNWENTLTSQISGKLSIEVKFNMLWDNQPVLGKEELDTRTLVNLVLDMW